jgi:hypothetical protein
MAGKLPLLSPLCFVAALLLVGCTSKPADGQSRPAVTTAQVESRTEVPQVPDPLDAVGFAPCEVLAAGQFVELGVSHRSAQDFSNANAGRCAWVSNDESFMIDLAINVKAGLSFAYGIHDSLPAFEETSIDGFPAVHMDPPNGPVCSFWVGIAEGQSFTAGARNLSTSKPALCEKAEALASEVIDALRHRS